MILEQAFRIHGIRDNDDFDARRLARGEMYSAGLISYGYGYHCGGGYGVTIGDKYGGDGIQRHTRRFGVEYYQEISLHPGDGYGDGLMGDGKGDGFGDCRKVRRLE